MVVEKKIEARLKTIQKRYNFNPKGSSRQIKGRPELEVPYARFRELLGLIAACDDLEIKIPYDPQGLNPIENTKLLEEAPRYLYFEQTPRNPLHWKCGYSKSPYKRRMTLQTGNPLRLVVRHTILVGLEKDAKKVESKVKMILKKRGCTLHGDEWFKMDSSEVLKLCQKVKSELEEMKA